jgi:hypothetical protein
MKNWVTFTYACREKSQIKKPFTKSKLGVAYKANNAIDSHYYEQERKQKIKF